MKKQTNEGKLRIRIIECGSIRHPGKGLLRRLCGDRLPVNCFVVQSPGGLLLVDTGADSSIVQRLQAIGVSPCDIDAVAFSCLDADHTGGLRALLESASPRVLPEDEAIPRSTSPRVLFEHEALLESASPRVLFADEELYWMQRNAFKNRQPSVNIEGVQHERFFFKASMDGPLHYKFDVFGDECVQLYLCTGHSFGTTACVVTNKKTSDFAVLAGDIILNSTTFEEGEVFHPSYQARSVQWLKTLAADPHCVAVLPTHESYGASYGTNEIIV